MRCNNCGNVNPDNVTFCANCGTPMPKSQPKIFCANCGSEMNPGAAFCGICGAKRADAPIYRQQEQPAQQIPHQPVQKPIDDSILKRAASRRVLNGILTLVLSLLQIIWPFVSVYGDRETFYYTIGESVILLLLLPGFIFFLINFIAGLRCIVVGGRMNSKPVNLLENAHSGGSIILIIFYAIMLIITLLTNDTFGMIIYVLGIVICGLKLGLDVKFIRDHKEELSAIEENYKASRK